MLKRIWGNEQGGVLIEKKALIVLGIVLIFGIGNLMIVFAKDYYDGVTHYIEHAGVETRFNDVIWTGKIN